MDESEWEDFLADCSDIDETYEPSDTSSQETDPEENVLDENEAEENEENIQQQNSNDRLYKVRPVLNHFNKTMREKYVPDKSLCIDESMVLWRGRLFFRQYIKNKKHKYGVKFYELCESNGMVLRIKIYCGKSETSTEMGHASDVVFELMEDYLDKGHMLFTDNFYNSVPLTKALTARKTYVCGTLRSNRKGLPKDFITKKLKKGEVTWCRHESVVLCKWKDKREVVTISNMHKVQSVEVQNRNGKISIKPNIIKDYNNGMSGVDRSDQMLS
ncbi:piggyBac transposable element-derived protein 4-like, partial [Anoplophora glabripennis]|uniref:piggyBac transposable element-derived protein 4-like n=1 Tax=Anoplophora glabripennis TaxID=217634 RepID=UPI000873E638